MGNASQINRSRDSVRVERRSDLNESDLGEVYCICTLFDIQCCQSVIRILVYDFMCRLDSSVNYVILATSLQNTSRIRKHWCSLLDTLLIVDRTNYIILIVYNLLHVTLDDNFIIKSASDCYVLLVCI